jgi:hypothetical protein
MKMIQFIKNLFSRKKTETTQPVDAIESAIKKEKKETEELLLKRTPKKDLYKTPTNSRPSYSDRSSNSYQENTPDFLTSMVIANATDSAVIGTLIGGDPVGAIVGDMMNDSDGHSSHFSYDTSSYSSYSYSSDSSSYSSDSSSYSSDSSSYSSDNSSSDF